MSRATNLERALAGWGADLPDWVEALARACDASSQTEIGKLLRYSRTAICLLVNGEYHCNQTAIETRIRLVLMRPPAIHCPGEGREISSEACAARAVSPMPMSSPQELRAWTACRTCPHSRIGGAS